MELPPSVHALTLEGREIFLVAAAHVSRESVEEVARTIRAVRPDTVCVELDRARYEALTDRERWKKMDIVQVLRKGKGGTLLLSLVLASFQRRLGEHLGVKPGAEMLQAVERAREVEAALVLADRDLQVTLKRTWGALGWWGKLKLAFGLLLSVLDREEIDEATVEAMKSTDTLAAMLDEVSRRLPALQRTLIAERDVYLAQKIRCAPGRRIVAVVGAGHVPGILREIHRPRPLEPLEETPPPAFWPRVAAWTLPLAIVALILYGFFTGDTRSGLESVAIWVGLNGGLSALGAALALGHPAAVASAFAAAPLSSLNPFIAAGWVSGLVQAWARRPTVADLEDLPEAITSLRGFWSNAVTRVLLVMALSNLGSTAGTFLAGTWIASRTL